MAITLGTFTKLDNGAYAGTLKTLNVTATLAIVPVDRTSDKAPDHRVYAGQRYEIGAGWARSRSRAARPTSTSRSALPNSAPTGSAAAWSSARPRPTTAPPTSSSGILATERGRSPRRHHAGGALSFSSSWGRKGKRLPSADCPNQIHPAGIPSMPCRTGQPQRCCGLPQFCRPQRARMRARVFIRPTKSVPPHPAARRLRRR
jgi:Protein of unknown function (DUF736)